MREQFVHQILAYRKVARKIELGVKFVESELSVGVLAQLTVEGFW